MYSFCALQATFSVASPVGGKYHIFSMYQPAVVCFVYIQNVLGMREGNWNGVYRIGFRGIEGEHEYAGVRFYGYRET